MSRSVIIEVSREKREPSLTAYEITELQPSFMGTVADYVVAADPAVAEKAVSDIAEMAYAERDDDGAYHFKWPMLCSDIADLVDKAVAEYMESARLAQDIDELASSLEDLLYPDRGAYFYYEERLIPLKKFAVEAAIDGKRDWLHVGNVLEYHW